MAMWVGERQVTAETWRKGRHIQGQGCVEKGQMRQFMLE